MRPWLATILTIALLGAVSVASAAGSSGGATAPDGSGGLSFGQPVKRSARGERLRIGRFLLARNTIAAGTKQPTIIKYRIIGRRGLRVPVRFQVFRRGDNHPVINKRLAAQPVRRMRRYRIKTAALIPGSYFVKLIARTRASGGPRVRVAQKSDFSIQSPPQPLVVGSGVFPIRGPYSFGDGFGVDRGNRTHEGQDLPAPEGTPVISPRAGTVYWRSFQAGGAGCYLVIHGDDNRDYVFMHLKEGSLLVDRGATVTAGQQIASVGSTGGSTGPHLHFEIWVNGWRTTPLSRPIDPLGDLRAWASK